jgi:phosphatidylglycerophosphatase A
LRNLKKKVFSNVWYFLAFGFGSGLAPRAPGTFGTIAAIPIYLILSKLAPVYYLSITILMFVCGVIICDWVSKDLGKHDFSGIVWDEIVGFLLTMFMVPLSILNIILGFCLFRIFDILKPWPISYVDKHVGGGLGVMLDDVLAAIPAWAFLTIFCLI